MSQNINYIIAKKQAIIDRQLQELPIAVSYYLIKTKLQEIEKIYNIQVQREIKEQQQQQQQQEKIEQQQQQERTEEQEE